MKKYIGTKLIKAEPMNRLDYNKFRGWDLPEDENGDDEGYLVEYLDGGELNVEGREGYVSWSPKEQFDKAYKPLDVIHQDLNGVFVKDASENEIEGHYYQIGWPEGSLLVSFQNGAVKENGVNGVTNESLLAVLIDRTKKLNTKFPCRENSIAITKMEEALMWFDKRTTDRISRDVEGQEKA